MTEKYGPKLLLACQQTNGDLFFKGEIIARSDSQTTTLADLGKGKFAFVDPHSTMGYLVSQALLQQENPQLIADHQYPFLGTHENVTLGVLAGDFEAGTVKEETYQKFKSKGLKILQTTPAIAEHLLAVCSTLAESTVIQLREALLQLGKSQEGLNLLHAIKPSLTGFAPVTEDDYNSLRQILDHNKQKENVR
jgi:phosphonate transport system substrate-binding protein